MEKVVITKKDKDMVVETKVEESADDIHSKYYGVPPEEEKKEEVKEEKKEEVKPEAPEEVKQPEPEKEKAVYVPEKKEEPKKEEKKEKLVPYDALHEERVKRKAEAESRKKAEETARRLQEEIDRLKKSEKPPAEEVIDDYDAVIKTTRSEVNDLKREIQAIKTVEAERAEAEKEEYVRKQREHFESAMTKIDRELAEEGLPGFRFSKDVVAAQIQRRIDSEEGFVDGEDDWKEAYRQVYPEIAAAFAEAQRKKEIDSKKDLKKEANLNKIPGRPPESKKEPDVDKLTPDQMKEEYMKMRRGEK